MSKGAPEKIVKLADRKLNDLTDKGRAALTDEMSLVDPNDIIFGHSKLGQELRLTCLIPSWGSDKRECTGHALAEWMNSVTIECH